MRRKLLIRALLVASPLLVFAALDVALPLPTAQLRRPPAVVVYDRTGEPIRMILPRDHKVRIPVTLDEVPEELTRALVASEDRWFWRHPGVNPLAIGRAAIANVRAGRRVSGASTIPMQIARMIEPKSRTLSGKVTEAFRALQLTRQYSKRELLEIYLNLAPYGGNVEGIGAASQLYFGKPPSQLSLGEIAFLTTLPRSPNRYDPLRDHATATRARDRVLRQLRDRGAFTTAQIDEAMHQTLPRERRGAPFVAPHFCDYAVRLSPGQARVFTTLDPRLQSIAEQQVASRIASLRMRGVDQTAVVVVDVATREVLAMVGSGGFFDPRREGQVNGATARRSPGSTLKPLLFAKAFDDGRLLPDSYVLDIPTDYGGYVAENYDGTYRGRVTVRDALVQSLNAPSVRLLSENGVPEFVTLLRRGGLTSLDRNPNDYGLPLILGGGEVRLIDLTNLYATLGDGGVHRDVRVLRRSNDPSSALRAPSPLAEGRRVSIVRGPSPRASGEKVPKADEGSAPRRLLSRESTALLTTILTELRRPDMPRAWRLTREVPAVAWKTGTSYGHRDAWSVGYSRRYAIGVWSGNFDGRGQKGMSGSEMAAPLLFDLFRAIEPDGARIESNEAMLDTLEVCAISRELPGEHCRDRMRIPYLPGRTRLRSCSVHRPFFVDAKSGERLSGDCVAARPYTLAVATIYPPELTAWRRAQGETVAAMPPLSHACADVVESDPPRILSPSGATPYRLRRDAPIEYQSVRLAAQGEGKLYWFLDGVLVPGGGLVRPERGSHRLVVVDEEGRGDAVRWVVE